ncbi:hypothetical protein V5O48_001292 [Marasmius crinis-equi]|uniref:Spindle pole body component n=1 Tax=Marasmius crinis-equi TaxID=585013 RepID=A0ABR3FZF1_9AGAR
MTPSGSNSSKPPKRSVSSLSSYPSTGNRPGSSLSIASLARPLSSASNRPISRASTQRPKSRQRVTSAKLLPLCNSLVNSVVGSGGETVEGDVDDARRDEQAARQHELVDFAMKNLSMEGATISKAAVTFDKERVDAAIRGHVEKARIRSRNTFAEALETCYKQLSTQAENNRDLDAEIKESRLPAHLQFLLALSQPPEPSTLTHASIYLDSLKNPPPSPESAEWTWKKILEEEPFEGEHWLGVPGGIPLRRRKASEDGEDDDEVSNGSTPSLSSLDTDDDLELDFATPFTDTVEGPSISFPSYAQRSFEATEKPVYTTHAYRKEVESLKTKQYWREDWKIDERLDPLLHQRGTFNIGNASTLGPTLQRVLPPSNVPVSTGPSAHNLPPLEVIISTERYIYEQDAVREILFALQGRKNILFEWVDGQFSTTKTTPRLLHLSLAAQQSILTNISRTCTTLQHLRSFTSFIILHSSQQRPETTSLSAIEKNKARKGKITRTLEAFADAVDTELRSVESWCARKEEKIIRALGGGLGEDEALVVSLLDIDKSLRDDFEQSFELLLSVVFKVIDKSAPRRWDLPNRSPSSTTALLLDSLFLEMQLGLERGDKVTADCIMRVFVRSAEAIWSMVGRWLRNGFDLAGNPGSSNGLEKWEPELEEEFFIESTGVGIDMGILGLLDPDFWADGYGLRDDDFETSGHGQVKGIPSFMYHVAASVLETGKSVGLLKALDIDHTAVDEGLASQSIDDWKWRSFRELVASDIGSSEDDDRGLFSVSVDRLSQLIYDYLIPYSDSIRSVMARAILHECDFWYHLHAIQGLYLMRKGDVISDFADLIFAKMDAHQHWNDFHFLNTAFSDVVDLSGSAHASGGSRGWVQTSLVRFTYRNSGVKEKSIAQTVKAIEGLNLEYAVPFPLTYIFTPRSIQVYGDIFVFLLQMRRSKSLLERILVRGERGRSEAGNGLKLFYAMRSRLSWFINTLLDFLVTNVIHTQVQVFDGQLQRARSLDHIIQLHDEQFVFISFGISKSLTSYQLEKGARATTALHQAVLSVLDMAVRFSETFVSFAGNNSTHDISTHSVTLKHRSRRQRMRQKNIVSFSHSDNRGLDSSDSEPELDELDVENANASSFSASMSTTLEEGDHLTRISKMSTELDGIVRFIRRGVETLAGGTGDAAAAFGVLAFALEDWDL